MKEVNKTLQEHLGIVSQVALVVKNLPAHAGDISDASLIPNSGRFPWTKARQPTPVF